MASGSLLRSCALAVVLVIAGPAVGSAIEPDQKLEDLGLDSWTTADGLPGMTVNDIVQTPDGYLWIGTYDGLARFDGARATAFRAQAHSGLEDDGIRDLALGREGVLWIATNGGGVSRLAGGRFTHFGPGQGVEDRLVWAVHVDRAGTVWAGTSTGRLLRLAGQRFVQEGPPGAPVLSIRDSPDGTLWLATLGGGVRRRSPDGSWGSTTHAHGLASDNVGAVLPVGDGEAWVAGSVGLSRIRPGGVDTLPLGRGATVWDVFADRHGTVWSSGASGRVGRLREGRLEEVPPGIGLPATVITMIAEDDEGDLWLGSAGKGLLRLRGVTFSRRGRRAGLPSDVVLTAAEGLAGTLAVGTSRGIAVGSGQRWRTLLEAESWARSVAVAADGTVWAGLETGVARLAGGRTTLFTQKDGLANDTVRGVLVDRHGAVWAATLDGLSRSVDGRHFTTWGPAQGLPATALLGLIESRDGSLWIGTEGDGVVRFSAGTFTTVGATELAGTIILGLREARDGAIWAGTSRGLARIDATGVRMFGLQQGIVGSISQMLEDAEGHLWLCGAAGVLRIEKAQLDGLLAGSLAQVDGQHFGTSDGLGSSQCTAPAIPPGLVTEDGLLHFFTWGGLSTVDPQRLRVDRVPPPVHIEEVLADGQPVTGPVPPGVRRLEFHYTGICLTNPRGVRFRYRLEGFDPDWVEADHERVVRYTNLPPGTYEFRVRAANDSGVWSRSDAATTVTLEPYVWQAPAFLAALAAALIALVALAWVSRVRLLRRDARRLASLVQERTRELEQATAAAEANRRTAEQADAAKTRLLGIVAHDLKNPLTSIAGYAQALTSLDPEHLPEMRDTLVRSSSRMIRLIDDLLLTAALESGRLVLRRARVDLTALVRAAVEEAQGEATRKGLRLELDATGPAPVDGDEDRLRQVVDNLLSNALKFSPRGSPVGIIVRQQGDRVQLEIRDEGPGLSREERERLFTAFVRLSAQPTGGEQSTGLGLSIVKQLMELHGGRAWAESEGPGLGSRFVIDLPRLDESR